jgi:hypothetical protein
MFEFENAQAVYIISRVITDNKPGGIENATHNTFPKLT